MSKQAVVLLAVAFFACYAVSVAETATPRGISFTEYQPMNMLDFASFSTQSDENSTMDWCNWACHTPITWDWPEWACTLDGLSIPNAMCPSGIYSRYICYQLTAPAIGFSYPGPCGCPNYCTNSTMNGNCVNNTCECAPGWGGMDCSIVESGNTCSGRGTLGTVNGTTTCQCYPGSAGSDCSIPVAPLPTIPQVIPSTQYTSWDDYGNENPIFDDSTVATIKLTMDPDELRFMLDPVNQDTREYLPATFWFYNGKTEQYFDKIGFRIKGGASRSFSKKSWKFKFNEYVDQSWAQQKKLSVKAMQMDPAATREKLSLELLYSMNAYAQRAAYAELFINDQFMGMYLLLEDIGNQFLKSRFGNDDGLLYKCTGDLGYVDSDPTTYATMMCGDALCYKPDSDAAEETPYDLLTQLITIINLPTDDFADQIESILDVDLFIRTLVVEVATGNFDGIWNGNNYFLYYNYDVNVFQYFRQDLDLAFGSVDNVFIMSDLDVYTWGEGGRGKYLIDAVLAVPAYRQAYTEYFYQLMDGPFSTHSTFVNLATALSQEISPALRRDNWRFMDLDINYYDTVSQQTVPFIRPMADFYKWIWREAHTDSIFGFLQTRISTALQQLDPR